MKAEQIKAGNSMKKLIILWALALLAACGTVEGVGEDISSASRGVRSLF